MTIKDVEKLTGLTAKSIRYYETKGLITIARNEDNAYRCYTEKDVEHLKWIKVLRYLDFSVDDIRRFLAEEESRQTGLLQEKAEQFESQKDDLQTKRELCTALAKDIKEDGQIIDEYIDTIDFLEGDDMAATMEQLKEISTPNLSSTILFTLIFSGPILWLFMNIYSQKFDILLFNALLALLGAALITWNWMHYITACRQNKNRVKKSNHKHNWILLSLPIVIIAGIAAIMGVNILVEKLLAPKDFLFYEFHPVAELALVWVTLLPIILIFVLLVAKSGLKTEKDLEETNDLFYLWNHLKKGRFVILSVWLIALYCSVTSINFVTRDFIVAHSPLHPAGITYNYSDIDKISTGFGQKNFSFCEYKRKGNFYYQVSVKGKTITFHVPYINEKIERYVEDSYLELEEFDQALMKLDISKTASSKGWENCDLDKQYVERFLRIIQN